MKAKSLMFFFLFLCSVLGSTPVYAGGNLKVFVWNVNGAIGTDAVYNESRIAYDIKHSSSVCPDIIFLTESNPNREISESRRREFVNGIIAILTNAPGACSEYGTYTGFVFPNHPDNARTVWRDD